MRIPTALQHRRYHRTPGAIVLAGFIWSVLAIIALPASGVELRLGTVGTEAFSHFSGRTICRLINRHAEDLSCQTVAGPDAVHNLTNLQGGSLDLALVDSKTLHDALHQSGRFAFLGIRYDSLRQLAPIYQVPVTLVVDRDAGITTLDGLKDKRFNAGGPGSAARQAVDMIMQAKQWTAEDFSLFQELPASHGQDTMAFCHGTVQAMLHVGVHPDDALRQCFKRCRAGLVGLNDRDIQSLVEKHPALTWIDIAPGTYPSQPDGVSTFGTRVLLVASGDLDDDTAYRILQILTANRAFLKAAHPALDLNATGLVPGILKPHPGAVRFFAEPKQI